MADLTKTDGRTSALISLSYQGKSVPAKKDGGGVVWYSLTEMAKQWDKRLDHWLRSEATVEYIEAVRESYGVLPLNGGNTFDPITSKPGNSNSSGTWAVAEVALEFARWLDAAFSVWVNKQTIMLLQNGHVELTAESKLNLDSMRIIRMANSGRNFGYQLKSSLRYMGTNKDEIQKFLGDVIRGLTADYETKNRLFKLISDNVDAYINENRAKWSNQTDSDMRWVTDYITNEWKNYRGRVIGKSRGSAKKLAAVSPKEVI